MRKQKRFSLIELLIVVAIILIIAAIAVAVPWWPRELKARPIWKWSWISALTLIQGYIFSCPLPVAQLPSVIERINTLPVPASPERTLCMQNVSTWTYAFGGY